MKKSICKEGSFLLFSLLLLLNLQVTVLSVIAGEPRGDTSVAGEQRPVELIFALPLRGDLTAVYPDGLADRAPFFSRASRAHGQDFSLQPLHQPRFFTVNGRTGLLIENGTGYVNTADPSRCAVNLLPEAARCENTSAWDTASTAALSLVDDHVEGAQALRLNRPEHPSAPKMTATFALTSPLPAGSYIFSFYAKAVNGGQFSIKLEAGTQSVMLAAESATVRAVNWQRYWFACKLERKMEADSVLSLVVTDTATAENASIYLDALQLEPSGLYMARRTPSSWISPGEFRDTETLRLPKTPDDIAAGEIHFSFALTGEGACQRLYQIGQDGWNPALAVDLRRNGNTTVLTAAAGKVTVTVPLADENKWHNVCVRWQPQLLQLILNEREATATSTTPIFVFRGPHTLGGSYDTTSPNLRADAVFTDYAFFSAAEKKGKLSAEWQEVITQTAMQNPVLVTPCRVFAQDQNEVWLHWRAGKFTMMTVTLPDGSIQQSLLREGGFSFPIHPGNLMPGRYDLICTASSSSENNKACRIKLPIEIVPARVPWENMQICSWSDGSVRATDGVTLAGINDASAAVIDDLTRRGQYSHIKLDFLGAPRGVSSDHALNAEGAPSFPDQSSTYVRETIEECAQIWAAMFMAYPNLRGCILNSEKHAGSVQIDFSERNQRRVHTKFGLDLSRWQDKRISEFHRIMPLGYLSPRIAPELTPPAGSVSANNPLYAFLLDWHTSGEHTDARANDAFAAKILAVRPESLIMKDPILRGPPLHTAKSINIHQDWVYYTDPKFIVATVEELQCSARPSHAMISVMPQFLFKPGMAAPFGGLPTADMLREAVHLACSRPARLLTFWNLAAIFSPDKFQTASDLDRLFGKTPTWQETAQRMKETMNMPFAADPRLAEEFRRLTKEFCLPFGALFPRWENRPRKIALINSFASDVFGSIRWRKKSRLEQALLDFGAPYDVLWDTDWTDGRSPQSNYDLFILPECNALPEFVMNDLAKRIERGAVVLVDEKSKISLPGGTVVNTEESLSKKQVDGLVEAERALLHKYHGKTDHPQYIEGMQQLQDAGQGGRQTLCGCEYILRALRDDFIIETPGVVWNHLHAAGADYLVLVNDRRIPGPLYGSYGKVSESGIAQTVRVRLKPGISRIVYDLVANTRIQVLDTPMKDTIDVLLPPCGIAILLFLEHAPDEVRTTHIVFERGKPFTCSVTLTAVENGLIPVLIELIPPGQKEPYRQFFSVIERGKAEFTMAVPFNAPTGSWTIRVSPRIYEIKTFESTLNLNP